VRRNGADPARIAGRCAGRAVRPASRAGLSCRVCAAGTTSTQHFSAWRALSEALLDIKGQAHIRLLEQNK